jgi:hypothetical protein
VFAKNRVLSIEFTVYKLLGDVNAFLVVNSFVLAKPCLYARAQQVGSITFLLEPIEEGTKFTYVYDYEMPWGVVGKLLSRLGAQRSGEKMLETDIANLKSILEK